MKKIHFGVIRLRKQAVNIIIAAIIAVVGGFAVYAGVRALPVWAVSGVYYNGDKQSQNISLMINVYWGSEYIDQMLDTLSEKNVKTTFFIGGTWAVKNDQYLQKIYDAGHEIGNHGYHHKDHDKISKEENIKQISNTHKIIKELLNIEMNLFAPPSGAYNKSVVEIAQSLGYKTIMWTRDTIDWRDHDSELIYSRAVKNASGGDLILMHPTLETANALPRIIDTLQAQGFNLTTVSETLGEMKV